MSERPRLEIAPHILAVGEVAGGNFLRGILNQHNFQFIRKYWGNEALLYLVETDSGNLAEKEFEKLVAAAVAANKLAWFGPVRKKQGSSTYNVAVSLPEIIVGLPDLTPEQYERKAQDLAQRYGVTIKRRDHGDNDMVLLEVPSRNTADALSIAEKIALEPGVSFAELNSLVELVARFC